MRIQRGWIGIAGLISYLAGATASTAQVPGGSKASVDVAVQGLEIKAVSGSFFDSAKDLMEGAVGPATNQPQVLRAGATYELRCSYRYSDSISETTQIPPWEVQITVDGKPVATSPAYIPAWAKKGTTINGKYLELPSTPPSSLSGVKVEKWKAPSSLGQHTVGCVLDPTQQFPETNENNNEISRVVQIKGPHIAGSLVVHPNAPVDPGVSVLSFDANITEVVPTGGAWSLRVDTTSPKGLFSPGPYSGKKVAAPGPITDLAKPYKVACAAASAKQICFRLTAGTGGPESLSVEVQTVCLPIKPSPGPSQPELIVHSPAGMPPGSVLIFSARIPRKFCEASFRVVRSPIDSTGAWSTGFQKASVSSPDLSFPETYTVPAAGVSVIGSARRAPGLCFVLEKETVPVDKWCHEPPSKPGVALPMVAAVPSGPSPVPASRAGRGAERLQMPAPASSQPQTGGSAAPGTGAAVAGLKPDLVIQFQKGGGWAHVSPWFEIRNVGKTPAGPSMLRFTKPGVASTLAPIGPVDSGSYATLKVKKEWLLYTSGGTVTADALNQIDEANETNNTYVWIWTSQ
jgi:hypothetical protein